MLKDTRLDGDASFSREDPIDGFPVTGEFFLRSVAGLRFAENDTPQAPSRDRLAFDSVGCLDALHNGLFAQGLQNHRLLLHPEILLPLGLGTRGHPIAPSVGQSIAIGDGASNIAMAKCGRLMLISGIPALVAVAGRTKYGRWLARPFCPV